MDKRTMELLDMLTARLGSVYTYEACPRQDWRDYMVEHHLDEELEMHLS